MLDRLPSEILYHTILKLRASDVSRVSQLNRDFQVFCSAPLLWRELFLASFDPPERVDLSKFDFKRELQRREAALIWLEGAKRPAHAKVDALEALVSIAESRRSDGVDSKNLAWLEQLVKDDAALGDSVRTRGDLIVLEQPDDKDEKQQQLKRRLSQAIAHLKVLKFESNADDLTLYREIVYENRFYLRDCHWGPFKSDRLERRVDWVKVEALMHVMKNNISAVNDEWNVDVPTSGWRTTMPISQPDPDWSGVSRTVWHGTYAFIDYRTYEHYNFHRSSRHAPSLENELEAIGNLMKLQLSVIPEDGLSPGEAPIDLGTFSGSDEEEDDEFMPMPAVDTDDEDDEHSEISERSYDSALLGEENDPLESETPPTSPPEDGSPSSGGGPTDRRLSFLGSSEQELNFIGNFVPAPAGPTFRRAVRGTVTRLNDGQIHYRWIISYGGADQWLLNGIQVGGAGSKAGILGTWSTAEHEEGGPNGPFWYWPVQREE